jgi:hypothetical protein
VRSAARGRVRRWLPVVAAAVLACALPTVVAGFPSSSTAAAPGVEQLRQRVLASAALPYTGYAQSRGALGLPNLPALGDVAALLSGTTDIRAWYASDQRNRVDTVDTIGERDVYTTPAGTYTWDYTQDLLTEVVGPEPVRLPRASDLLPPDLARRALQLDPRDPVTALPARRIAGVDAAGLRLRPADPATTIGEVDVWADPGSGLPLRVDVTPRGAPQPVLTTQFLTLDRADPDPAALTPPVTGAGGVSRTTAPDVLGALGALGRFPLPASLAGYPRQPALNGLPGVARYGSGAATFVVLPLPSSVGDSAVGALTGAGATKVDVARGRAVQIGIPLLNVLVEQVGFRHRTFLVAGLVDPAVVRQAGVELAQLRPVRPVR